MCMICVDEVVFVASTITAAAPWYRSAWARVWNLRPRLA